MSKTIKIASAIAAIIALLGLSACAEKPAEVAESPSAEADASAQAKAEAEAANESAAEDEGDVLMDEAAETDEDAGEDYSEDTGEDYSEDTGEGAGVTHTLGQPMQIGDWEVRVTKVVKNANTIIAAANQFNDAPKHQYVLVTYDATYTGAERTADAEWDLTWTLTTNQAKILDDVFEVTPADAQDLPTEARNGGTVKMQVVFDVKPSVIEGGLLSVEGEDANLDTVYADFDL